MRQRLDFLHKTANDIINKFDKIFVEKLNISGMLKNHNLAKSIADVSWSLFFKLLSEKAESAARIVKEVPAYGTSQECSNCNKLVPKKLSQRKHVCPHCGFATHRDHNAALNVLQRGLVLVNGSD